MADDADDRFPSSSSRRPFVVPDSLPFVFLPSAFADFHFVTNQSHDSATDDQQATLESIEKRNVDENSEEIERNDESDDGAHETNNLRISQPKYSQLLKELDFSQTRMVDVTDLLLNRLDSPAHYLSPDENENLNKTSGDEKYQSLSSARASESSDEPADQRTPSINDHLTDDNHTKHDENLTDAANEIQNDLNNLAAMIQRVSPVSTGDDDDDEENNTNKNSHEHEKTERSKVYAQKKLTFDEDDDTSKQATQNYDLHDYEKEDLVPSSRSSKIPRLISQRSNGGVKKEDNSFIPSLNINNPPKWPHQSAQQEDDDDDDDEEEEEEEIKPPITWENLVNGTEQIIQPVIETIVSEQRIDTHLTPRQSSQQQPVPSSHEQFQQRIEPLLKPQAHHRFRQISSSSSNTESIVEHELYRAELAQQISESPPHVPPLVFRSSKQGSPSIVLLQTLRQDSQGTLLDDNLDDLTSQLKQGLFDQERQTLNTSTKEERTTDGIGSMSFPLSTSDILSTDMRDNDVSHPVNDMAYRRVPAYPPTADYNHEYNRRSFDMQQHSNPPRRKSHHRHHHRHSTSSRHIDREQESNSKKADENWLGMLEKLEREHRARLEKQQQQYEHHMHSLEEKMQQRFDEYLTLTSGFQESRLDNFDDPLHMHRTHTSIPIDSNIGRYKSHTQNPSQRTVVKDLISHYYPADSTLNILTSGKKRPNMTNTAPQSQPKDETTNIRTELSARHAKQIADLKLYYEYEINELTSQLNRSKMGHTSSSTRQSIETIERMNHENIRLHDDVNALRHSQKVTQDENVLLKRQLDELREQITSKDLELKNYHRTIADLEQQLTVAENTKERQDEKVRHADRQALLYREETEKIKTDLSLTRDRLLRLEERYREQENENETLRRQLFIAENNVNRTKNHAQDDIKLNSTMAVNIPTSRDYGRFPLRTSRHSSSTINNSRDGNLDAERYQSTGVDNLFRHSHSPRSMTRISDYLNEKPLFPSPYIPPSRPVYSPRKPSPNRRRVDPPATVRSPVERQTKPGEQLEQKFDQLLKKKRDLEARINRIPTRNLTSTDRQLYDVLEREIERVEQQISSVKLSLRKSYVLRPH